MRKLCDRQDGNRVSAKYDIWIWLWRFQAKETLSGAVDAAISDEAEVLMLKQSVVLQQIGITYCLEFTPRLLHFWS